MQHGGSLSINPQTGLPEAGFLENILPTVLGFALTPFMGPLAAGLTVGGIETVRTGDIGKGFLAGLGAYGGSNLAGSLAQTGTATAASAAPGVTEAVASGALPQTATSFAPSAAPTVGQTALQASFPAAGTSAGGSFLAANPVTAATTMGAQLPTGYAAMGEGARALGTEAGRATFMDQAGGLTGLAKTAGMAGAPMISSALTPKPIEMPGEEKSEYAGPYKPSERQVSYPGDDLRRRTSEFTYFTPSNPIPFAEGGETAGASEAAADIVVSPNEARVYQDILNVQRLAGLPAIDLSQFAVMPGRSYEQFVYNPIEAGPSSGGMGPERNYGFEALMSKEEVEKALAPKEESRFRRRVFSGEAGNEGFAKGGVPMLEDGGFVLTKKAVDGLGKGDNKRGQKAASRGLGAIPIKGPGTGTSDSIKTSIEGKRPALVSNGEAYVPKKQVAKHGGAKKFYALMKKAERRA
jgi:hypothetical protein